MNQINSQAREICIEKQSQFSADAPITSPTEDVFGFNPFSREIARAISGMHKPIGTAIGIHGAWGSGKSSAINLIKYHLQAGEFAASNLEIIEFNPWWFTGLESLAQSFLSEIGAKFAHEMPGTRKIMRSLGKRLSNHSSLIGAVVGAATLGAAGSIAENIAKGIGTELDQEQTIQEQHQELSQILARESKRYLIIIDDIDRLEPAEMLQIFKLVKSVGRLPNVMYLLVFDLTRTEKVVAEAFPAEDAHYLEKILQASFAAPAINDEKLQEWALKNIIERLSLNKAQTQELSWQLKNCTHSLCQPRDVIRLMNSLEVTWPALKNEANPVDFALLEFVRLFYPRIHRLLSLKQKQLCYRLNRENNTKEWIDKELALNNELSEPEQAALRKILGTLFPQLNKIWKNTEYDHHSYARWHLERRVSSAKHFPSYFKFEISHDAIPQKQWDALITTAESGNQSSVKQALCDSPGAQLLLADIECAASLNRISENACKTLLKVCIKHGELLRDKDTFFEYIALDSTLAAILCSLGIDEAWPIFQKCLTEASNGWLINAIRLHQTKQSDFLPFQPEHWEEILNESMKRLDIAKQDNSLWRWDKPITALYAWKEAKGLEDMQNWLKTQLIQKDVLLRLAATRTEGGDALAITNRELLPEEFLDAVNNLLKQQPDLTADERNTLINFKAAWQQTQAS